MNDIKLPEGYMEAVIASTADRIARQPAKVHTELADFFASIGHTQQAQEEREWAEMKAGKA